MANKKAAQVEENAGDAAAVTTIALAAICAEMGIKPQAARIKLRKKLTGSKEPGFRWVFPIEQKDEIVALLTPQPKAEKAEAGEGDNDE